MATEGYPGSTSTPPGPGEGQWTDEYADVVELAIARAQRFGEMVSGFVRDQPYVAAALGAAVVGALVGVAVAGLVPRRRPPTPFERARETLRRASERGPWATAPAAESLGTVRSAAELLPISLRLMANPFVRQMAWRLATAAMRRARQ